MSTLLVASEIAVNHSVVTSTASRWVASSCASLGPLLTSLLIGAALVFIVEGLVVLAWMIEKGGCACQLVFVL